MSALSPLRLYFSSVPGDMDGERAVIEELVLPELRKRLHEHRVEIVFVDPAKAKEEWDLARRFQEIESCDLFVALVGERYGTPPSRPLAVVAAQPWLVEDPGRSVVELEILLGALREPGKTASFFYFRNPRFPSMVPEGQRERFLPENDESAARLAGLKERIRASGRPVFDGYPCGWSEGLGRASRLDTLAEHVFEELWQAIQEQVHTDDDGRGTDGIAPSISIAADVKPPGIRDKSDSGSQEPPPPAHVPFDKPPVLHENVQFTVYRPRTVEPMKWYPLLAFAHLEELPADAPADEPDPLAEVRAQAHRALGDLAGGYADVKQDSQQSVPHEAEITFLPQIPGFEINPPRRTFLWLESVHREEFRIRARPETEGKQVRGRLSVFWGSILLAEVSLAIHVDSRIAGVPASRPERIASRRFGNIFPSYSHQDASIVEEFERYARTLGIRYLRDVHELRAGEVWNHRLKELIQKANVFQLFWSWNALRSRYVEEEWRYALSLRRSDFIRPTYWEDPLPEDPKRSLPPEELRQLHFYLLTTGTARRGAPHTAEGSSQANNSTNAPSFDPNATILEFPGASSLPGRVVFQNIERREEIRDEPPFEVITPSTVEFPTPVLEETWPGDAVATVPPLAPQPPVVSASRPVSPPMRAGQRVSSGQRRRKWMGVATMIALAVLGLSLYRLQSRPEEMAPSQEYYAVQATPPAPVLQERRLSPDPASMPAIRKPDWSAPKAVHATPFPQKPNQSAPTATPSTSLPEATPSVSKTTRSPHVLQERTQSGRASEWRLQDAVQARPFPQKPAQSASTAAAPSTSLPEAAQAAPKATRPPYVLREQKQSRRAPDWSVPEATQALPQKPAQTAPAAAPSTSLAEARPSAPKAIRPSPVLQEQEQSGRAPEWSVTEAAQARAFRKKPALPDPTAAPAPSLPEEVQSAQQRQSQEQRSSSYASRPFFPVITPATWQRLAAACRLDAASVRSLPTRVAAGSPIVQVASSDDWLVAARALDRFAGRGAFLLPLEENGHAVCTVALGPFPSEEDARRTAAELRVSDGLDAKVVPFPGFTK